jgi:hypothetical protein
MIGLRQRSIQPDDSTRRNVARADARTRGAS